MYKVILVYAHELGEGFVPDHCMIVPAEAETMQINEALLEYHDEPRVWELMPVNWIPFDDLDLGEITNLDFVTSL